MTQLATLNPGRNRFRVYVDNEPLRALIVAQPAETAYKLRERIATNSGIAISRIRVVVWEAA